MITSAANPQIRELILLREKKSHRLESQSFFVEGWREFRQALEHGYQPIKVFFCESVRGFNHADFSQMTRESQIRTLIPISEKIFSKIAVRSESDGICAIFRSRGHQFENQTSRPGLWVVIEGGEKPGNIGAVFRSAESLGVGAVILTETNIDLYNPNLIRSSLGAVFSVPSVICKNEELLEASRKENRKLFVAAPESAEFMKGHKALCIDQINWTSPSAIIFGSEAEGVSSFWQRQNGQPVTIPMTGSIDSLNLSVSAALFMYEALRQKLVATTRK